MAERVPVHATPPPQLGAEAGRTLPTTPRERAVQRGTLVDRAMGADPERLQVPGQQFAVLSYVAPSRSRLAADQVHIKIHGCFPGAAEAQRHAEQVRADCEVLDVFVVAMYRWLRVPPPTEEVRNVPTYYADPHLQAIMEGIVTAQQEQRAAFENRMRRMQDAHAAGEARKAAVRTAETTRERLARLKEARRARDPVDPAPTGPEGKQEEQ